MQTTFKLFFSFLFCFVLSLMNGCGDRVTETPPTLTPVEQAEVDKFLKEHGKDAIIYCMFDMMNNGAPGNLILKYVKYFVSQGADVNPKGTPVTPLHCGILTGDFAIVTYLVSKGADVNAKCTMPELGGDDVFPLHLAFLSASIRSGPANDPDILMTNESVAIAKFLVSNRADVQAKTGRGTTPLMLAAQINQIELIEFLISNGADVNQKILEDAERGITNMTLLHYVAGGMRMGRIHDDFQAATLLEITKLLVARGADVNAKASLGGTTYTPLDRAKESGNTAVVEYLSSLLK